MAFFFFFQVELSARGGRDFARVLPSVGGTVGSLALSGREVLLPLGSAEEARANHRLGGAPRCQK